MDVDLKCHRSNDAEREARYGESLKDYGQNGEQPATMCATLNASDEEIRLGKIRLHAAACWLVALARRTIHDLDEIHGHSTLADSQKFGSARGPQVAFRLTRTTSTYANPYCSHFRFRSTRSIVMHSVVLCALLQLSPISALAEESRTYQYVDIRLINGPCCTDQGTDLVVDDEGSILIAGYRGSLDFNRDGKIDMPTFGRPDAFISKVSLAAGENTGWNRGPGGPKQDRANGIASDRAGGVFAVGTFTDSLQMTETTTLRSKGGKDGFLARYGRDSQLMWGRVIGGTGEDRFVDVASDSKGNAYVIGVVGGPVDVNQDGEIDVNTDRRGQALVVSFSPDGELRWMRATGGSANSTGGAVTIGPNDEIYISGTYSNGAPDFDGDGELDLPSSPETSADALAMQDPSRYEYDGFYARLTGDGKPLWIRSVSGPAVQGAGSLGIAANGDLLVLGGYSAPPDLDGDGLADLEFTSMVDRKARYEIDGNTFLLQVSPDGKRIWAQRYSIAARHVVANDDHILLSGTYSGVLDVDDDGLLERESDNDDQREGFTVILDSRGEVQQVLTVVGDHHDTVTAAGFSPDGNTLYLTGYTSLGADFNGDGEVESASVCHKAGELYLALYALHGANDASD